MEQYNISKIINFFKKCKNNSFYGLYDIFIRCKIIGIYSEFEKELFSKYYNIFLFGSSENMKLQIKLKDEYYKQLIRQEKLNNILK